MQEYSTSPTSATQEFLAALRSQTAAGHDALERAALSKVLVTQQVTMQHYGRYMQRMYGIVVPVEREIYPICSEVINDADERMKAGKLRSDLVASGMTEPDIDNLPNVTLDDSLKALPAALGCMYVLEGSTLGGNVIYKNLHKVLGIEHEKGGAYFSAYGSLTGKRWSLFIENLSQYAVTHDYEDEVIKGAVATFGMLRDWFDKE